MFEQSFRGLTQASLNVRLAQSGERYNRAHLASG